MPAHDANTETGVGTATGARSARSAKRLLYMSGSAGLGHVTRDLAIAREIRFLAPAVDISWLASSPAKEYLRETGEDVLPEAEEWADLTSLAEAVAKPGRLNITHWALGARHVWAANARLYFRLMGRGEFDAAVGDETYEVPMALSRNACLPRYPLAVIYDFIGLDAVTRRPKERLGNLIFNRVWSRCLPSVGYTPILVGEIEDVPAKPFGPCLPDRRAWTRENVRVVGYAVQFDPARYVEARAVRSELGYGLGPLVACTIGGTAVGRELLELCGSAFPLLRNARPDLEMVLFCGPRLAPDSLKVPRGVQVKGFVPDLYRHLAACDVAVTQAGGTTTLELTALRKPFLYFPLEEHSEQMRAVTDRLRRHGVGEPMIVSRTSPQRLADRVLALMNSPVDYAQVPVDGARGAARIVLDLL
jgi:UDP:flavonoid glycosyltransferase YjiC (YdhE family)